MKNLIKNLSIADIAVYVLASLGGLGTLLFFSLLITGNLTETFNV